MPNAVDRIASDYPAPTTIMGWAGGWRSLACGLRAARCSSSSLSERRGLSVSWVLIDLTV